MKVSFVRTKPKGPKTVAFKDLVPGEWYTMTPWGNDHRQKLRGYQTHDGYIEKDCHVFFTEADWTEVYPVNQPESPKPSWDDFKPGWVAKAKDNSDKVFYILHKITFGCVDWLYEDGRIVCWHMTGTRLNVLLDLYPPGSGYLKMEI